MKFVVFNLETIWTPTHSHHWISPVSTIRYELHLFPHIIIVIVSSFPHISTQKKICDDKKQEKNIVLVSPMPVNFYIYHYSSSWEKHNYQLKLPSSSHQTAVEQPWCSKAKLWTIYHRGWSVQAFPIQAISGLCGFINLETTVSRINQPLIFARFQLCPHSEESQDDFSLPLTWITLLQNPFFCMRPMETLSSTFPIGNFSPVCAPPAQPHNLI